MQTIDKLFSNAKMWRQEAEILREILRGTGLAEEVKWGKPCYTYDGKNICIIQRMKGFLALLFFKGALLEDPDALLEAQGPNSRSGYRMRFSGISDVENRASSVKLFINQAIEIEAAGLKVNKESDLRYTDELIEKFDDDPELKAAFHRLTPGRQRGYVLHFSGAKQSKTRVARIEKYRRNIFRGKGIQER